MSFFTAERVPTVDKVVHLIGDASENPLILRELTDIDFIASIAEQNWDYGKITKGQDAAVFKMLQQLGGYYSYESY